MIAPIYQSWSCIHADRFGFARNGLGQTGPGHGEDYCDDLEVVSQVLDIVENPKVTQRTTAPNNIKNVCARKPQGNLGNLLLQVTSPNPIQVLLPRLWLFPFLVC